MQELFIVWVGECGLRSRDLAKYSKLETKTMANR